ncbi:MAG: glyoxylate/hydroxypyruvate reductase A [Rhodospirillales bacterium]|nr:glyoxylate/hydroxypyruvate reductase A [Rhodospirillales bacterium]
MAVLFRPFFSIDDPVWVPALREALGDLDFRVWPDCGDPADITAIVGWEVFPEDRNSWPNLKVILSLRAGVERFLSSPHYPPGVKLVRMIDPGLTEGMREYVAAFVLRFHRDIDRVETDAAAGEWPSSIPVGAAQRTVGFLGFGHLGQACVPVLQPFGFRLRGWSLSKKSVPGVESFTGPESFESFLAGTDILVCLLPLTPETENCLNAHTLGLLPRGAYLINAARGRHLVEGDLIPLLDSGHLGGAALDVFRREPLPAGHPFHAHPKIIVTPHISAITIPQTGALIIRQSLETILGGEDPPGLVDFAKGY